VILEVELENIKSYEYCKVTFSSGLNAIIGENGAGKTTILEAIGFTLFDSLPYRISDFLRSGTKKGFIKIRFVAPDGRTYEVVRRISETGTTEYSLYDPEIGKIAEGKEVVNWIKDSFGIESDIKMFFENAIGVLQGKMTSQFLEPPSVRDKIFSPLIGVESYKKAFEKSREYENMVNDRLKDVEKELYGLEKDLENLRFVEKELNDLEDRKRSLLNSIKLVESKLDELERSAKAFETLQEKMNSKKMVIQKLSYKLNAEKSELQKLESRLKEIVSLEKSAIKVEKEYKSYLEIEKRIEALKDEERVVSKKVEELNSLQTQYETLKTRHSKIVSELNELENMEREREKLVWYSKKEKELSEKIREIEKIEVELNQLKEMKSRLREDISNLKSRIDEMRRKEEKLKNAEEKLKKLEGVDEKYESILKNISILKAKRDQLSKEFDLLKQNICPILKTECNELSGKREEMGRELSELTSKLSKLSESLKKAKKLYETKIEIDKIVQKLKGEIKNLQKLKEDLEAKIKTEEEIAERITKYEKVLECKDKITNEYEAVRGSSEKLNLVEGILSRKNDLINEKNEIERKTEDMEREIGFLKPFKDKFEKIVSELEELKSKLEEKKPFYEEYLKIRALVENKPKIEAEIGELIESIHETESKLRHEERVLKDIEKEYNADIHESLKKEIISLTTDRGRKYGELKEVENLIKSRKDMMIELKKKKEEYERLKEHKYVLEKKREFIRHLREIFKLAIPEITKAYVSAVSSEANRIFCEIMNDYNWEINWTEDFGIKARYRGREIDFAQMSGGEQMCASIAIRLALLSILSGVGIAFFDEPTQNMDEVRRRNLASQLTKIDGFKQIFVISHDDTFEEMVENAIKIEKENGTSKIL